jgi:hypothetical protein
MAHADITKSVIVDSMCAQLEVVLVLCMYDTHVSYTCANVPHIYEQQYASNDSMMEIALTATTASMQRCFV